MKTKFNKQQTIQELTDAFQQARAVIFLNLTNLSNTLQTNLRQLLKRHQGLMKVAKRTLIQKALPTLSIDFKQPLALLFDFSEDLRALRSLRQFEGQINLLGGWFQQQLLTTQAATALVHLPSQDILVKKLLGLLTSPIRSFVTTSKLTQLRLIKTLAAVAATKTN